MDDEILEISTNANLHKTSTMLITGNVLVVGNTYHFGGYDWVVAEIKGNCAVLQSCGVTTGPWPGFKMPQFGNGEWYGKDIDGLDIHTYNTTILELYEQIKDAEFVDADYGKGLFLTSTRIMEHGEQCIGNYPQALKIAANNHFSFGTSYSCAWLGTCDGCGGAYYVKSSGIVSYGSDQDSSFVIAPAFNLDLSKAEISGSTITIKEGVKSEDNSRSQSVVERKKIGISFWMRSGTCTRILRVHRRTTLP